MSKQKFLLVGLIVLIASVSNISFGYEIWQEIECLGSYQSSNRRFVDWNSSEIQTDNLSSNGSFVESSSVGFKDPHTYEDGGIYQYVRMNIPVGKKVYFFYDDINRKGDTQLAGFEVESAGPGRRRYNLYAYGPGGFEPENGEYVKSAVERPLGQSYPDLVAPKIDKIALLYENNAVISGTGRRANNCSINIYAEAECLEGGSSEYYDNSDIFVGEDYRTGGGWDSMTLLHSYDDFSPSAFNPSSRYKSYIRVHGGKQDRFQDPSSVTYGFDHRKDNDHSSNQLDIKVRIRREPDPSSPGNNPLQSEMYRSFRWVLNAPRSASTHTLPSRTTGERTLSPSEVTTNFQWITLGTLDISSLGENEDINITLYAHHEDDADTLARSVIDTIIVTDSYSGTEEGVSPWCSDQNIQRIDGVCGDFQGSYESNPVNSSNACAEGTYGNDASQTGSYVNWTCEGSSGGQTTSCSVAISSDGECGETFGTCLEGTPTNLNNQQCGEFDTWTCAGAGGGTSDSCSLLDECSNGLCGDGYVSNTFACPFEVERTLMGGDHYQIVENDTGNSITVSTPSTNFRNLGRLQGEVTNDPNSVSPRMETDILLKYDASEAIANGCNLTGVPEYYARYERSNIYSPSSFTARLFIPRNRFFNREKQAHSSYNSLYRDPVGTTYPQVKFYPLLPDGTCDIDPAKASSTRDGSGVGCVKFEDPFESIKMSHRPANDNGAFMELDDISNGYSGWDGVTPIYNHGLMYMRPVYGTEECDDGNSIDGDGCSSTCEIETIYNCTGPVPDNSSICTQHGDDDDGLSSNTSRLLVPSCTSSRKCEYICDEGFERDGTSCVPKFDTYVCGTDGTRGLTSPENPCSEEDVLFGPYQPTQSVCADTPPSDSLCQGYVCQGGPLVNAIICPEFTNEARPAGPGIDFTRVDDCSNISQNTESIQCQYQCEAGYYWDGTKCESTTLYSCQVDGTWTDGTNGGSDVDAYPRGTPWRPGDDIVLFDDVALTNNRPDDSLCEPRTCGGVLPDHASVCTPTADELTGILNDGVSYSHIGVCSNETPAIKCEYQCDSGYAFVDDDNDGIGVCEEQVDKFICNGTTGTWNPLSSKCGVSEIIPPANPAAPNDQACARTIPTTACQAWTCGGTVPDNATSCGNITNLPDGNEEYSHINDCDELATQSTSTYCNFECNENQGYEFDGVDGCRMKFNQYSCQLNGDWRLVSEDSCTSIDTLAGSYEPSDIVTVCFDQMPSHDRCDPFVCQTPPVLPNEDSLPANEKTYTICADDEFEVPDDSTSFTNVTACSDLAQDKCEFVCINNHIWDDTTQKCIPEFTTYECLDTGNRSEGTNNDCTVADFVSGVGYSQGSIVCIDPSLGPNPPSDIDCNRNKCLGDIPSNGILCDTDDQALPGNVPISLLAGVDNCSDPAEDIKCEYYCPDGFSIQGDDCVADYTQYTCGSTDTQGGVWIDNGPGCAVYDYVAGNPYTLGDQICTDTVPSSTECVVCQDGEIDVGEECDDGNNNDNDACINVIENGQIVCKDAICGDGFVHGGVEECDGQVGCTACSREDVACTLSVSSSTISIGAPVTFTYSHTGPTGMIITPLNFDDSTDAILSGGSINHTYTAPGVYTASFAVINPGIQTTVEPLASRVKKVCEATVTVQGGLCGNNQIDTGEQCELINGEVTSCSAGGLCNPYTCQCQNTCDEVVRELSEQCDFEKRCANFRSCSEDSECSDVLGSDKSCILRPGCGCDISCTTQTCGDGIFQPQVGECTTYYEECEYTGPDADPGCTNSCVFASCGDGIRQPSIGEQCDEGKICFDPGTNTPTLNAGEPIRCETNSQICLGGTVNCRPNTMGIECTENCVSKAFCGDGIRNTLGNDGIIDTDDDEQCDEGESNSQDGLCWSRQDAESFGRPTLACKKTRCGDGYVQENGNGETGDPEQCDDGNSIDDDSCSNTCIDNTALVGECKNAEYLAQLDDQLIRDESYTNMDSRLCEQGFVTPGSITYANGILSWTCDVLGGSLPPASCVLPTCGDGVLDSGETCDDGNEVSNDGCSSTCQQEPIINPIGTNPQGGATCVEAGAYPIIHDDEYLPFWWQGERAGNTLEGTQCPTVGTGSGYLKDSAMCYFGISRFEGLVEVERNSEMISVFKQPCFDATPGILSSDMRDNDLMIIDALDDHNAIDATITTNGTVTVNSTEGLLGVSYLVPEDTVESLTYDVNGVSTPIPLPTTNEIISRNPGSVVESKLYGQYEIKLLGIQYDYCTREKTFETITTTIACDENAPGAILQSDGVSYVCSVSRQQPGPISDILTIPMYYDIQDSEPTLTRERIPSMVPEYSKDSEAICRIPFTISKPYFVQRGTTFQEVENSDLGEIYDIDGTSLTTDNTILDNTRAGASQSTRLGGVDRSEATEGEESAYNYLLNSFSEQYDRLAIIQPNGDMSGFGEKLINNTRKVPRENIFFYDGDDDINPGNDDIESSEIAELLKYHGVCDEVTISNNPEQCDPFTLVFKRRASRENQRPANLNIRGNLSFNAMYLVDGEINFATDRNDIGGLSCDDAFDIVDGILLAKSGFTAERLRNDDLNEKRCMRGGLQVRGLLFGAGLDQDLFDNRRSAFSSWEETLFDANPIQKAGDLFNTCYMPTLVMRHLADDGKINIGAIGASIDRLFVSGESEENDLGNQNNGPVSFPAFELLPDGGFDRALEDEQGQPIKYCNIETYPRYKPAVDAMRTKLIDTLYQTCEGNQGIVDSVINAGSNGYCGDGIAQEELGERCDFGDNPDLRESLYCTKCSAEDRETSFNRSELTPKEKANIVNLSEQSLNMLRGSGMQVTVAAGTDMTEITGRLESRASQAGISLKCNAGDDTRVTRNMIRRVLNSRFSDINDGFRPKVTVLDRSGGGFLNPNTTLGKLFSDSGYGIVYGQYLSSKGIFTANYDGNQGPDGASKDGVWQLENIYNFVGISEINSNIDAGSSFGVRNNSSVRLSLPPGGSTFIDFIQSDKF